MTPLLLVGPCVPLFRFMCWFAKREKGEQRAGRGEEAQEGVCVCVCETLADPQGFVEFLNVLL